jgi:hypothetical protein
MLAMSHISVLVEKGKKIVLWCHWFFVGVTPSFAALWLVKHRTNEKKKKELIFKKKKKKLQGEVWAWQIVVVGM